MSSDVHTIFFSKFNKTIGIFKIKLSFSWLHIHAFHTILGNDRTKLFFNNRKSSIVASPYLIQIQRSTDIKLALKSVLEYDLVVISTVKLHLL
ncbi:hypothetical protein D3C86_1847910 [compost metagenome]